MRGVLLAWLTVGAVVATAAPSHSSPARQVAASDIGTARLRGGVEGIRRALGDRLAMPPSMAVAELTRRFHGGTDLASERDPGVTRFRAWLHACATTDVCDAAALPPDSVPLPGSPAFWRQTGVEPPDGPDTLLLAILESRGAALLYTALLSMDPVTRAWFLERPDFVRTLSGADRGTLVVAAPYLRVEAGRFQLPGGPAASAAWEHLVGVAADAQPAFVTALVRAESGHLAYLAEVVATLSAEQQRAALGLSTSNPQQATGAFMAALRDLLGSWQPGERPFWRPSPDPAFLLAQIPVDGDGRLAMPGARRFWGFVLADDEVPVSASRAGEAWHDSEPLAPAWLVAQLASVPAEDQTVRYQQMLFASRLLADEAAGRAPDVATAIRGVARFPPLMRTLERTGVADAVRLAAMVRQAEALTRGGEGWRARATLVQWQAAIALLDRMARGGALPAATLDAAIAALSAPVPRSAVAPWLEWLAPLAPAGAAGTDAAERALERALVARITASALAAGRRIEWEGTSYRLDFVAAERDRLARVRGRDSRPLLDAARVLAPWLSPPAMRSDELLKTLAGLTAATGVDRPLEADDEFGREAHGAATRARRALVAAGHRPVPVEVRDLLRDAGHALAAAGLAELVYAANMGWADDLPLTAAAASRRHVFVRPQSADRDRRWAAPSISADRRFPWHVSGSLLGLDVALAPVAMRRLSLRPLPASPLLNTGDRAALVATAAVLDPHTFTDDGQQLVHALVSRAIDLVESAEDVPRARQVAAHARLSPLRTSVFEWRVASDRGRLSEFFSMTELVRIGLGGDPAPAALGGWGNYALAMTGKSGAGSLPSHPIERYAGRVRRLLATAIPDLQLGLAFRLAQMRLPAALVPPLMASASFDVVNTSPSRYTDDWEAVVSRVRGIDTQAVERYLGLLTTGGPLRLAPASVR